MVLTLTQLKARFAAGDEPSAKDFVDMIDTLSAANYSGLAALVASQVATAIGALPLSQTIITQATPPNAGQAASIWLQLDANTQAILRAYRFSNLDNCWHARHPLQPGVTVLITTPSFDVTQLSTYDGGGTPGNGAMWELVTDYAGKFPLITAPPTAAAYPFGATGGEATHTLTVAEAPLPQHTHDLYGGSAGSFQAGQAYGASAGPSANITGSTGGVHGGAGAPAAPHNNMPPYKTCYLIRRTTRLDYVVTPGA